LQLILPTSDEKKKRKKKKKKGQQKSPEVPMFMAEPMRASNSFVGTEEYIAPVCISAHIICMIQILIEFVKNIILVLFELVRKCIHYFFEFVVNLCRKL
jgi:hypothetical protein